MKPTLLTSRSINNNKDDIDAGIAVGHPQYTMGTAKSKALKKGKVEKVMHEFKEGELHSGSKKGPEVTGRKQAIAIALSEARKGKK